MAPIKNIAMITQNMSPTEHKRTDHTQGIALKVAGDTSFVPAKSLRFGYKADAFLPLESALRSNI